MQRWALTLLAYDYDIEYRRSSDHANADALSRLPCDSTSTGGEEETVFQVSHLDELPICAKDIATETRRNPLFSKVLDLTLSGWPSHITDEHLKPFYVRKDQLSTDQGCILWGSRVIIPPKYRERLLSELHEGHPGIVRMKALARGYLWWPGLDQDIQDLVSKCTPCELGRNQPPSAPLYPWSWATTPWERIHIDYAEIDKQHFLLIVDAHSKWVEILPTHLTSAEKTINILRHLWASYGFPKELVSDNGPPFTSREFEEFLRKNGVRHVLSPPYHPATNGQAERVVQIFKKAWERLRSQSVAPHMRLARFLLTYRNTPHTVTERTPAELFLKRQPRICLTLVKPDTSAVVVKHQEQQKRAHDTPSRKLRSFEVGQKVIVRNSRYPKCAWTPGVVLFKLGPLTYQVQVGECSVKVHVDHLLPSNIQDRTAAMDSIIADDFAPNVCNDGNASVTKPPVPVDTGTVSSPERRYPLRQRKTPHRLDL
ncbi:gypsy-18 is [Labeo rohita]|uniref:Gypsy retrotransposon integrase-like protein 1 n=1 Tax=Labeo rohita TaxID=84645 RepID=A0A498M407_LABRO|nr:gypsy-18 is [Labeo rohita]